VGEGGVASALGLVLSPKPRTLGAGVELLMAHSPTVQLPFLHLD
jgi:hypothetical protein